mmetsp:Transcript_20336/g.68944  ORF Transcript_20336/g.68944 Transcript_20336/m.68944 type:complete len:271 (-) Transcript_20336:274-1086(-)
MHLPRGLVDWHSAWMVACSSARSASGAPPALPLAAWSMRPKRTPPPDSLASAPAAPLRAAAKRSSSWIWRTSFDLPSAVGAAAAPRSLASSSSPSLSSSPSPSTMIFEGGAALAPESSSSTLALALGGRRRAVVGRVERLGCAPPPSSPSSPFSSLAADANVAGGSDLDWASSSAGLRAWGGGSRGCGFSRGGGSSLACAASWGAPPAKSPPERTACTAFCESGAAVAATARSWRKRFVFSGSRPETIFCGRASTMVFSWKPTSLIVFAR